MTAPAPVAAGGGPARRWRLRTSRRARTGSSVRRAAGIWWAGDRAGRVAGGADGLGLAGDAAEGLVDVGAVDGFAFQEQPGEPVQGVAVLAQHPPGAALGLAQEPGDLLVDDPLGGLGIGAAADLLTPQIQRAARGEPHRPQGR